MGGAAPDLSRFRIVMGSRVFRVVTRNRSKTLFMVANDHGDLCSLPSRGVAVVRR